MRLLFNTKKLEHSNIRLSGDLPLEEMELDELDELIHLDDPLHYEVEVQKLDESFLVRGSLELALRCECVRCLKSFRETIALSDWSCLLPLDGEDKVLIANDSVDLTPYIREDIVLALPQHPLCRPECGGLVGQSTGETQPSGNDDRVGDTPSVWAALDNLKL